MSTYVVIPSPVHSQLAAQARIIEDQVRPEPTPSAPVQMPSTTTGRAKPKHFYTTGAAQNGVTTPWRDFSKKNLRTHHWKQLRRLASCGPLTGRGLVEAGVKEGQKHMPELVALGLVKVHDGGRCMIYEITDAGLARLAAQGENVA